MQFFFYGTLMDPDVREVVVPHVADRLRTQPAVLPGYRRLRATRGNFPVLVRRGGGRVGGLLLEGLDAAALLRIAHFEGEEYVPWPGQVVDSEGYRCRAWLFLPSHDCCATGERWSFGRWRRLHKRRLIRQTEAWMTEFGSSNMRSLDVPWHVRRRIHALLTPTPLTSEPSTARRDQELEDVRPLRVAAGSRRY